MFALSVFDPEVMAELQLMIEELERRARVLGNGNAAERRRWPSLPDLSTPTAAQPVAAPGVFNAEVAQHPLERYAVGVVVLPGAEVTDVTVVAELGCPGFLGGERGVPRGRSPVDQHLSH